MTTPTLWYVHPYAGGPGVGRYSRPYELGHAWQQAGARVVVITADFHHLQDTPGHYRGAHDIEGVPYEFLRTPAYQGNGLGRLANMGALAAQLLRHRDSLERRYGKPDIVIGSSPHPYAFPATHRVARRYGAHSVFEVRDLWPLSLVELAGVRPTHPLVRATAWLERYAYTHADAVVSLLPKTAEYMRDKGLPPDRWHYIPNGVDTAGRPAADVSNAPMQQAQRWKAEGRRVVVYAGALGVPNHVESLVQAMAILRARQDSRIAALIVGRGERAQQLRDLVRQQGLDDCVALHDQIAKREVPALLGAADIGYISLKPEPLFRFGISPNKLFDYMLARLPVLFAVEAGNNPVADHDCGFSARPGDAESIAQALQAFAALPDTELAAMGRRGHGYVVSEHGYPQLAQRYLGIADTPQKAGKRQVS